MKHSTALNVGVVFLSIGLSLPAWGFGWKGNDGSNGPSGRNGRDGTAITIQATGTSANFDLTGSDGGPGGQGEYGRSATSCQQPLDATSNQTGADGGNGGQGGNGGRGGHGGTVTVYYEALENVKGIFVRNSPGNGGFAAWGGRGGEPCYCQVSSWTPPGSTTVYYCQNGDRGRDGMGGANGARGSYGSIALIPQLTPVLPEKPAVDVEMSTMESAKVALSKNLWESRTGARELFAAGSDIPNSYTFYAGRVEATYAFQWLVDRPVTDFKNWRMTVRLEGKTPKLYLPSGLWVDGSAAVEGSHTTYTFRALVATNELGNLQWNGYRGVGREHTLLIKDSAEVSNLLKTTLQLKYYAWEAGNYKLLYDKEVPAEAVTGSAQGFEIAMGKLGLEEKYLKIGTQAYAGLVLTRALGDKSVKYQLGSYYTIKIVFAVGDAVEVLVDSDLLSGSTVVGKVKAGEKYQVSAIQGDWISLKKLDGTAVTGWIQSSKLKK